MKYLIVVNKDNQGTAVTPESELLDILLDLVNGIRQGQIPAESYDKALVKLIEAGRVMVLPASGEVSG